MRTDPDEEIKAQLHALATHLSSPEQGARAEEGIYSVVKGELPLKIAAGIPEEVVETLYQQGYLFFQSGHYHKAIEIFQALRMLDPTDARMNFAIAACYHRLHQYMDASTYYLLCKGFDPTNPLPSFHLYDCLCRLGHPLVAWFYLEEALVCARREPQYSALCERLKLERAHVQRLLKGETLPHSSSPSKEAL